MPFCWFRGELCARAGEEELRRLVKRLRGLLPLPKLVARSAPGNATKVIARCRGKRGGGNPLRGCPRVCDVVAPNGAAVRSIILINLHLIDGAE